jgi:hypothetical protein
MSCGHRLRERTLWVLVVLALAHTASAQTTAPPAQETPPGPGGELGPWEPLGPAPVDQAGTGSRGYVLPMEDTTVTLPGSNRFSVHAVAANYFYREQTAGFLMSQRYETHTLALDYRRGFAPAGFPRFEIGGHVQLHQSNGGMLNGFIESFESFWASVTGSSSARNTLRTEAALRPPQGTSIARNGLALYNDPGTGSGLGDVYVGAKFALVDRDPSSTATRVSARAGLNVGRSSRFSEGNFFGMGVSLDKKLLEWVAFHGDVRATRTLDDASVWNLPLERWAYGFSAGSEFRLARNSSLMLQFGGSSSPYLPTGTTAFDRGHGDITFGVGHRFGDGPRRVTMHVYARENMNLPFRVRWNTDPDLSVGVKFTIQ